MPHRDSSFFRRPIALIAIVAAGSPLAPARGQDPSATPNATPQDLERRVRELEIAHRDSERARRAELESRDAQIASLAAELEARSAPNQASERWYDRFTLGGYGEIHYNQPEHAGEQIDIHRMVLYLGYRFNDWISLFSETELEHALVSDDNGELVIEQLYAEFALGGDHAIRAGRMLAPFGIVNQRHEPPLFNGVERPTMETVILPSTWTQDGVAYVGRAHESLTYQVCLTNGLDGSGFDDLNGIRGGRQDERPGMNHPAVSARADWHAFTSQDQGLRIGLATYFGDVDNGNQGANPGVDAKIRIYSADAEYSVDRLHLRGVFATEDIDGATDLSTLTGQTIAETIIGWYVEAAYDVMPTDWKTGRLADSDAQLFVRYDDIDTQHDVPSGLVANPAGDRHEWTVGLSFHPARDVVVKIDYQIREDESAGDPPDQFNVGLGWRL